VSKGKPEGNRQKKPPKGATVTHPLHEVFPSSRYSCPQWNEGVVVKSPARKGGGQGRIAPSPGRIRGGQGTGESLRSTKREWEGHLNTQKKKKAERGDWKGTETLYKRERKV